MNRKLIWILALVLLALPVVSATPYPVTNFTGGATDDNANWGLGSCTAQSFKIISSHATYSVNKISFKSPSVVNSPAIRTVVIAHNNGAGDVDYTDIRLNTTGVALVAGWNNYTFASSATLDNDTEYWLVVKYTPTTGAGDYMKIRTGQNGYSLGSLRYSAANNCNSYSAFTAGWDWNFIVYETVGGTATTNFTITANNNITFAALKIIKARTVNASNGETRTYSITNGQINTTWKQLGYLLNITVGSTARYRNRTYINWNVSNNLVANLTPYHLNITSASPRNNTQFSSSPITFRLNVSSNMTSINCSLKINNVVVSSKNYTNLRKATVNFTKTFATSQQFNSSFICIQPGSGYQINLTQKYHYFDATLPTIKLNLRNGTIYYKKNITAVVNLSDDFMIYDWLVAMDGVTKYSKTDLNSTFYQLNLTLSPSSLSIGKHILSFKLSDGHTAQNIEPMTIESKSGYIKYSWIEDKETKYIKIYNKAINTNDVFTTTKLPSKYTWTYTPKISTSSYTLVIESNTKIVIKNKKDFGSWIIAGTRWIDFFMSNENPNIAINRISDMKAEVTISNLKDTKQIFNSIGELNIIYRNISLYKTNYTISYVSPKVETQLNYISLILNKTGFMQYNTTARFKFNGTSYAVSRTNMTNATKYYVNFTIPLMSEGLRNSSKRYDVWYFNFSNAVISNYTHNFTQTVYKMHIDNCVAGVRGIEFNSSVEGSTALITTNASGNFKVWLTDSTLFRNRMITWNSKNSSSVCILPNVTLHLSYALEYGRYGYNTRHRTEFSTYINKTLQKIRLYLLPTTGTSTFTIALKDQINNPIKGFLIKQNRFNYGTNNYSMVQSEVSDSLGYGTFFSYLSTAIYRYKVYNTTGGQVYDSGDMYPVDNPTIFRISLLGFTEPGDISIILDLNRVNYTLFNHSTVINFTWFNKGNYTKPFCLKVYLRNMNESGTLYTNCSSSATGSLTYNVTRNGLIFAYAYAQGSKYSIDTLIVEFKNIVATLASSLGKEGLLYTFVLFLLFAMGWAWNPAISGVMGTIGIVGAMWIGFFPFTWQYLVWLVVLDAIMLWRVSKY